MGQRLSLINTENHSIIEIKLRFVFFVYDGRKRDVIFDWFDVNLSGKGVMALRDAERSSLTGGRETDCEAAGRKNN